MYLKKNDTFIFGHSSKDTNIELLNWILILYMKQFKIIKLVQSI